MDQQNTISRCLDHNEFITFLARSKFDQKIVKLCHKCVVEKKKDLVLIDDAKKYLQETKLGILEERESLNKQNVGILNDLKQNLENLSLNFNLQIDKIKENIGSGVKLIETFSKQFQKVLTEISFDQVENVDLDKSSIIGQQLNWQSIQMDNCLSSLNVGEQSEALNQLFNIGSFIDQQTQIKADWICDKHEQGIVFVDLSEQKSIQNRLACLECIPEYVIQYTNLGQLQKMWQKHTEQALTFFNVYQSNTSSKQSQVILQLKEFREVILKLFEQLIESIQIKVQIENNDLQYHHKLLQKTWQSLRKEDLINIVDLLSSQNRLALVNRMIEQEFQSKDQAIDSIICSQMQQLQNLINSTFPQLITSTVKSFISNQNLNQNKIDVETQIQQSLSLQSQIITLHLQLHKEIILPQISKPFSFEVVSQISESTTCQAFALNNDSSILIAGQDSGSIKVFEFNFGQLREIQLLKEHSSNIRRLYFMQKASSPLSAGDDNQIILWKVNNQKQWQSHKKLEGHTGTVSCLIMNNQEDLIISGSNDKTINFWVQENQQWKCNQTISDHTNYVRCLSLNVLENMLISCGKDNLLLIILQDNNKRWSTIQKISTERCGYSLCFITDQMFTFQQETINIMHIYQLNTTSQQFIKMEQEVSIKSDQNCSAFFPQKFVKEKQILLNKNGKNVNLIRLHRNGQFKTEQSIQNSICCGLFGTISNDGSYLVTFESDNKVIKVRKYREN
ncbi:unnamed protein product (macronuclear) [Paramecium tetraurelia]|uniref:Uncharacterized protein n=1 Tax=Paramecium tetraurelia TaxID=5888 RepID=A0CHN5_PARTE|nr:uncharacterized protein GSPATT00038404001 [Paramecium tetraurelia]CAK70302.1 unnamed protein product [Paramecium tetraurelia]|eukprot:XP_001437699.1 hypothetical protein (macronuclear) [Paramecium tetraurelia strain d4-2]